MSQFKNRLGFVAVSLVAGYSASCQDHTASEEYTTKLQGQTEVNPSQAATLQSLVDDTSEGDTIVFEAGTYEIDSAFRFRSGRAYVADSAAPPNAVIFKPCASCSYVTLEHASGTGGGPSVRDVRIAGIVFDGIGLDFRSSANDYTSYNIVLDDLVFMNGDTNADWSTRYVYFGDVDGAVVNNCTFLRSQSHGGKGVSAYRTHNVVVHGSHFGTTRHLPLPNPDGHFKTAINLHGGYKYGNTSVDSKVHGNVIRRDVVSDCGSDCEDHGVYGLFHDGIEATANRVDGWSYSGSGGAFKLRNSANVFVFNNRMMTSGIRLYTQEVHEETSPNYAAYRHLYRVHVHGNWFSDLDNDAPNGPNPDGPNAILYNRVDGEPEPPVNIGNYDDLGYEEDIYWRGDNSSTESARLRVDHALPSAFCIESGTNFVLDSDHAGVQTEDCVPADSWDRPLSGVFSGDFNGDGIEDLATRIRDTQGNWKFRVYASEGEHRRMEDWGAGAYVGTDTEDFGIHVGDFAGDDADDILYYGKCGGSGERCWRVHAGSASGGPFTVHLGFGNNLYSSSETLIYGVHVGDFDNNGKDDLLYRGKVGAGVLAWRVHLSDGSTFSVKNFGDGASFGDDSPSYGLLIGDYDNNGEDDVAYVGDCSGSPCFKVHLNSNTANSFGAPQVWDQGGGIFRDSPRTEHFGIKVGDVNGDGKADLAYRGKCGSPGTPRWRYHQSTGTNFSVYCSDTLDF